MEAVNAQVSEHAGAIRACATYLVDNGASTTLRVVVMGPLAAAHYGSSDDEIADCEVRVDNRVSE